MQTPAQFLAAGTAQTVVDHIARQRWEDGDASYHLGMVLADLIVFASIYGLNFEAELRSARETVNDAYEPADIGALSNPVLPSPQPLRAAALALAESMTEALDVHIYNDDLIPIDSGYVCGINAVYDALALPRPDIETAPFFVFYQREGDDQGETEHYVPFADFGDAMEHAVALMRDNTHPALTARVIERTDRDDVPLWHYDATFADNEGESVMFTTTVPGRDGAQAHERGRQFLEAVHGDVRKVDSKLYQVLG